MKNYLEVIPLKHVWLFGGGGSSGGGGGGGTTSNTTTNQQLPWAGYVPGVTSTAYSNLMPILASKAGEGLTPQEKSAYTGQGMSDVAKASAASDKVLAGNLARSGARGGAVTEAYSDAARSKVGANQGVTSNIQGLDIQQKQANLSNLMKGIAIPGSPITAGTTGVTSYSPQSKSGGGS